MEKKNNKKKKTKKPYKTSGIIVVIFGIICIIMSIVLNSNKEDPRKYELSPQGGIIGPLTISKDKTVLLIEVSQKITRDFEWSFVTGELLDNNKNYLFGFGEEFWKESGRDSEGPWSESVSYYDTKITIPQKGSYYLKFSAEKSQNIKSPIIISISRKLASGLAFMVAGIFSLIIGVILSKIG